MGVTSWQSEVPALLMNKLPLTCMSMHSCSAKAVKNTPLDTLPRKNEKKCILSGCERTPDRVSYICLVSAVRPSR